MRDQESNQSLDLSSFGTKVSDGAMQVSGQAALDLSAFGTPVDVAGPDLARPEPSAREVSENGFLDRRIDDAQRGWHRSMQGLDIQDLDRRTGTSTLLDQIDAGTYKEPVERWERLSEDPRAKQYRLAGPEERAQIRQTLRGAIDEDITDLVSAEQKINQLPQSDEARRFGEAEDFGSAWDALADAPVEVISSLATESLGQQSPYLPLMAIHPALGAGAGSYITEKGADIINSLREAGVDFSSEESIREGLSNPEQMAAFRQHAARRGLAVGLVDAISGGLAGKYAAGATTTLSRIGRGAVEDLVMQPALGAAGEAVGAIAAGDDISGKELLAEAAGEIGPGAVETTVGTVQNVRRRGNDTGPDGAPEVDDIDAETGERLALAAPVSQEDGAGQGGIRALPPSDMTYGDGFVTGNFPDLPEPDAAQIEYEQKLALPPSRTVYTDTPLLEGPKGDALPAPETSYGEGFTMADTVEQDAAAELPAPDQFGRVYGEGFVAGDDLLPPAPGPNYVAMVDRSGRQTGWFNPETAHAIGKELGAFEAPRRRGPTIDEMMKDGRSADEIRAELVETSQRERAAADVGSVVRVKVPGKRTAEQVRVVGFAPDATVVETRDGQKIALSDNQIPQPEQLSLDLSNEQPRSAVAEDIQSNRLAAEIEQAAQQAQAPVSEAQAEAGNYRKGHVKVSGLDIAIENQRGSIRSGQDKNGKSWSVQMPAHYGYIKRTEGADGDHVDVYVGPDPDSQEVYVIDQMGDRPTGFDEHKVMIGFKSAADAQSTYLKAFNDGKALSRLGAITPMTIDQFKTWLRSGDTTKPVGNIGRPKAGDFFEPVELAPAQIEMLKSHLKDKHVDRNSSAGIAYLRMIDTGAISTAHELNAFSGALNQQSWLDGATRRAETQTAEQSKMPWQKSFADFMSAEFGPRWVVSEGNKRISADDDQIKVSPKRFEAMKSEHQAAILDAIRQGKDVPEAALSSHASDPEFSQKIKGQKKKKASSGERYSLKRDTGDITKSDAFKRWFGDSKVVDSNGDPLVVYHGSPDARGIYAEGFSTAQERFNSLDRTGPYFLTNDSAVAESYADDSRAFDFQNAEPEIIAAYIRIRRPLEVDAGGGNFKGISINAVRDAFGNTPAGDNFNNMLKGMKNLAGDGKLTTDQLGSVARRFGRDGVIVRNVRDTYNGKGKSSDVFMVFSPEQIKSVNNRGTFDPEDPRILYRLANEKSERRVRLEDAVIAEIKRLAPAVKVEIRKNGKTLIGGKKADAGYIPVDDLIWTAMDAADPTHAGRHEVVHHLRATGRLTEAEWSILQRKAKSTWRKQYRVDDYREQYSGDADIETVLDEEAVAEAFADWMEGGSDAKGGVGRIFRKIKQFFDRIASVVRGQGYQSAEDVFRSIDDGEVGKRATNDLEKMKQQRAEYFAMSGLRKKSGSAAAKPKQKASPLSDAQEAAIKRTMANIEDEQPMAVRVRETLADAVDYIKHGAVQHVFDQFDSIKRYEKATYGELKRASMSAYKMARLTTNLQSTMAAVLRHGPLEYKNGAFQVRKGFDGGFEAIFADLSDRGLLKAWKGWAVANRAARLAREGRENNMTAQDIALLKDLDKQYPEFRDVMKRWTAFNKAMLDMAEQTGLLDPDARALFEHDDYVPFYRAIDDTPTGPFRKKGLANQRSGINRLKGGEAEVNDLIDNMVRNMTQLVDASMKNVAAKRVLRTLKTAGLDDGSVIMKVPHDAVPVHVTPEEAAQALENIGVQVQGMTKQQHDQWLKLFTLRPPKDPDVVSVMVGGKPQYFRVNDPLLLASMTSLGTDRVHWLVSILGYPKRWLTTGVTATPGFMLRNFIRDSLHGWVVSGEKFRPGIDGFKGAIRSYREDTALVNIMAAGGGSGGFFRTQSRDVAKMLSSVHGKNAIIDSPKKAWEWWKRVGQATENANRLAIYDSVLKDTGDVAEAAYQALDIMDFSMRGDSAVIRFLIGTIPFLNARMQGLYRLGRGMKQNPKAFMLRGGLITAATMLLYSLNADDDRYDELPEWEKDAYYHIFLDRIFPEEALEAAGIPFDEFHVRLPKPFEVGALFSTIPERATRLAQGKDDLSKYGERMWSMLRDTFAVDLPQFVKPLAEQWANEVTFTGSPIIPERMQDLEPEAQYDARTSELAKQIGDALPDFMGDAKSPKRIEAAVRAFFGSYGVYVMGIADEILDPIVGNPVEPDLRGDQMPEIGSFIRQQPYSSTRFVSEFYELKREIEAVAKTYKQYRSQGQIEDAKDITRDGGNKKIAMAGWMRRKAKQMSGINKQIRSVEESRSLTSAQKRKQIDRLSEQRNELAEQVVKALNKAGIK